MSGCVCVCVCTAQNITPSIAQVKQGEMAVTKLFCKVKFIHKEEV